MALIGWDNLVERPGTVLQPAYPGSVEGLGVQQLLVPVGNPASALQSTQGSTVLVFGMTLPAPAPVRAICLARTNLTAGAKLQLMLDGGASYALAWTDAGVVPGVHQVVRILPAAVMATEIQIGVDDPGNPDGNINIPLAWAGDCAEFNLGYESAESRVVRAQDVTTRNGTLLPQPLSLARSWALRAPLLRDAQSAAWAGPLEAAAARRRNMLFIPRLATAPREAVLGLLESGPRGFVGGSGAYRTWSATISERL